MKRELIENYGSSMLEHFFGVLYHACTLVGFDVVIFSSEKTFINVSRVLSCDIHAFQGMVCWV